jgi:Flp pilus assembly pilin Flp
VEGRAVVRKIIVTERMANAIELALMAVVLAAYLVWMASTLL